MSRRRGLVGFALGLLAGLVDALKSDGSRLLEAQAVAGGDVLVGPPFDTGAPRGALLADVEEERNTWADAERKSGCAKL